MVENQTAYEHEEEIDLVALCFTLLHKYRQLLAAALACAVIFGAAAGIRTARSGSVSEEAEEDYAAAMTEYLEKKESYEAASMTPTSRQMRRARVRWYRQSRTRRNMLRIRC